MVCEANSEATFAPLAALKLLVAQQVSCQKAGPDYAQRVASSHSRSSQRGRGSNNSGRFGPVHFNDLSCHKSGALGAYGTATQGKDLIVHLECHAIFGMVCVYLSPNRASWLDSTGTDIACKSAIENTSDDESQARDGTVTNIDGQNSSNVAHNLVNPDNEHTDFVPVGLPELHKVLISLLEPLQSRLEQLLKAQQGALPPFCPNGPAAAGQQDHSSFEASEEYSGESKTFIASCSQWQRSKLSSQSLLHLSCCSVEDSCKNVTVTWPSPENTLSNCDFDSLSSSPCRRPRQLRKLHHMLRLQQSILPVQMGDGQASFIQHASDCKDVQSAKIPSSDDVECQPRQSTWMSRSQQADDGTEWESCPTAEIETEDTSIRPVRRRGRRQSRKSSPALHSCEPYLHREDNVVIAQLLDVLKAEELCWGGQQLPSSEVSGIDFSVPPTVGVASPEHCA
jgi:hypothetical protein